MYRDSFQDAVDAYGKKQGVTISMLWGASILKTNTGQDVWLESPENSPLVLFHIEVFNKASYQLHQDSLKRSLELNSQLNITHGAWLSIHSESDTLRLCASIPRRHVDSDLIDTLVENLATLSQNFHKKYLLN